jgi:hypothetical protein
MTNSRDATDEPVDLCRALERCTTSSVVGRLRRIHPAFSWRAVPSLVELRRIVLPARQAASEMV